MGNLIYIKILNSKPSDWNEVKFGEVVIRSQYGLSLASSIDGNTIILGMNNLKDGKIDISRKNFVKTDEKTIKKYTLERGDLLFNRTNSYDLVGKTAIFENEGQYVFASYLVRFVLNKKKVEPGFVSYFFNCPPFSSYLKSLATPGVSQYNINPVELQKNFRILIPPISEQRNITIIISLAEKEINNTLALIEAKKKLKNGLMQQFLTGKKRFEEFIGSAAKRKTPYGKIPTDWKYPSMREIAEEVSERNSNGKEITVLSCTKYDGLVSSQEYFRKRVFSKDTSDYKIVKRGQFAYATNHIEEGSIGLLENYKEGLVSPMYTVFKTRPDVHPPFLYKLFKTELYRHIFEVNTSASVDRRGSLRWKQFALIHVPLPSFEEQVKISDYIDLYTKEISLLEKQLNLLNFQKTGLMQKLLTGQVRVKV